MATGFSYTTLIPVLVHHVFPGQSEIFGISMTFCAIGGIIATILLPMILNKISTVHMYYLSSCLFGIALLGVVIHNVILMFMSMSLVGLFSQWARTSNRIYFQEHVYPENRGKLLSVIMMDRGMIPLGSLLMTALAQLIGVLDTFLVMGLFTTLVALTVYLMQRTSKVEE